MSPTARSLAECKRRNWHAQVVERYCQYSRRRIDLFSVIDIVAIADGCILGIQATSGTNHAARVSKALEEPRLIAWLKAGGRFAVWSWAKQGARGKRKRWTLREEEAFLKEAPANVIDDVLDGILRVASKSADITEGSHNLAAKDGPVCRCGRSREASVHLSGLPEGHRFEFMESA